MVSAKNTSGFKDSSATHLSENISAREPPAWFDEFSSARLYASHIVLSGNIRDAYPVCHGTKCAFLGLDRTLAQLLARNGAHSLLAYDPVGGLALAGPGNPGLEQNLRKLGIPVGARAQSLAELAEIHAKVTASGIHLALLIDYASHLHGATEAELNDFFIEIDKTSRDMAAGTALRTSQNPTIWLADHPADLPDWFVVGNGYLRDIHVELPNLEDRFLYAKFLAKQYGWDNDKPSADRNRLLQQLALECDGEPLTGMQSIARVADAEGIPLDRISDAVRVYRTGIRRNPWTSKVLFDRVRQARSILGQRIMGQQHALDKTLDILARSVVGLSGAQSGPRHARPRGVLFLAGPTGVGKTELAKAVTELLFGDETACHRFDMSEFMEESSVSRLIGAPPGHPGHDRGGELVNAAHRRPFSVFLFDEIEKAHPRILDVFLQILDEGRLTDSRGATAHFSESLIIFTSNIGVVKGSRASNLGMNVLPSDSHNELEYKINMAIQEHFRTELRRPELLNRIGQNIVVFDFLSPDAAQLIFNAILGRVQDTIALEHGITISIADDVRRELKFLCTQDFFDGGRGIGNRIETHFINPLSRALFESGLISNATVTGISTHKDRTELVLQHDG